MTRGGASLSQNDTANDSHAARWWRCLCNGSKNTNVCGRATTSTNVLKNSGPATVALALVVAAAWPPPPEPHKNHPTPALVSNSSRAPIARPERACKRKPEAERLACSLFHMRRRAAAGAGSSNAATTSCACVIVPILAHLIEIGQQPMTTADGAPTMVYNGEIYKLRGAA